MQIRLIESERYVEYIKRVKAVVAAAMGVKNLEGRAIEPLQCGFYLALWLPDKPEPVGLAEAYFIDQAYADSRRCPLLTIPEVRTRCSFNNTAYLRTIYVEPEYRARLPIYSNLYLGMATVMHQLGALYGLAGTAANDGSLVRLYQKSGGRAVAKFAFPDDPSQPTAIFLFDVAQVLNNPRVARVSACLNVDQALALAIRQRKP